MYGTINSDVYKLQIFRWIILRRPDYNNFFSMWWYYCTWYKSWCYCTFVCFVRFTVLVVESFSTQMPLASFQATIEYAPQMHLTRQILREVQHISSAGNKRIQSDNPNSRGQQLSHRQSHIQSNSSQDLDLGRSDRGKHSPTAPYPLSPLHFTGF